MKPAALCLAVPSLIAVVSLGALFVLGHNGWPGETGVSGLIFCEALRSGMVKQPANTWSNLGFIVTGLVIGWQARRDLASRATPGAATPMRSYLLYPTLYASVATFLGPGSMAMHGTTTAWGGSLDVLSMYLFVAFTVAYGIARVCGWGRLGFLAAYAGLAAALASVLFADLFGDVVVVLFGGLLGVFALLEAWMRASGCQVAADRRWLALAAAAFVVAFVIWLPSRTGGPWCAPASLLQGHAIWHLLNAVSVGAIYLYYRSEVLG